MNHQKVFKIGIAMAGAVSAGAYTAGVMDYLLETLDKWKQAKDQNNKLGKDHPDYDPSLPMHDVVIEVIGGASAGGMTAAITTLAAFEGICPANQDNPDRKNNKLYDCWVNLNDEENHLTLQQMLECDDITSKAGVGSLLNSSPIQNIADKAAQLHQVLTLPPYISPDLDIILTITSLRGIPISLKFSDKVPDPATVRATERGLNFVAPSQPPTIHGMKLHKGIAHFKLNGDVTKDPHTISFNPHDEGDRMLLMDCAKATGAFPIGLKSSFFEKKTPLSYIKNMVVRMFSENKEAQSNGVVNIDVNTKDDPFDFVAVDGGTVNNEPFGEIMRALEDKCGKNDPNHAVIMIDPFPNIKEKMETVRHPRHLLALAPSIISAIRGQAMVKESDILRGFSKDYKLRIVSPERDEDPYPIGSGALDGFGGFFSRDFREHDFKLGRKNGQGFLRKYFTVPLEEAKKIKIFEDWQQNDEDARHLRFFIPKDEKGSDGYYPIIPDMDVHEFCNNKIDNKLPIPDRAKIPVQEVMQWEDKMNTRFTKVLLNLLQKTEKAEQKAAEKLNAVDVFIARHYRQNVFGRITTTCGIWVVERIWRWWVVRAIARYCTKQVMQTILRDFDKRGLLELEQK